MIPKRSVRTFIRLGASIFFWVWERFSIRYTVRRAGVAASAQRRNRILIDVVLDKGVLFCNVLCSANTGAFSLLLLHSVSNKAGPELVERISQAQQTRNQTADRAATHSERICKTRCHSIARTGGFFVLLLFLRTFFAQLKERNQIFVLEKCQPLWERQSEKKSPTTITRPAVWL